jgi:hypothetical protein
MFHASILALLAAALYLTTGWSAATGRKRSDFDTPNVTETPDARFDSSCAQRGRTGIWGGLNRPLMTLCFSGRDTRDQDPTSTFKLPADYIEERCDRARFGARHVGPATPYVIPHMPDSCVHNERIAILNRSNFLKPPVDDDMLDDIAEWTSHYREVLFGCQNQKASVIKYRHWIARYDPAKQAKVQKGATNHLYGGDAHDRHDAEISGMVKRELALKADPLFGGERQGKFDPRLIQYPGDGFSHIIGPTCYTALKALPWGPPNRVKTAHSADPNYRFEPITCTSGMDRNACGRWYEDSLEWMEEKVGPGNVVAFCTDLTRMDAHLGPGALRLERIAYNWFFRLPAKVTRAFKAQLKTRGRSKQGIKYTVNATRHSGDQNTTVGNTIISAVVTLYLVCAVTQEEPQNVLMRGAFLGDDTYVMLERTTAAKVQEYAAAFYSQCGLVVKAQVHELEAGEFCSSVFTPTSTGTQLSPKPGRLLARLFYIKDTCGSAKQIAWTKSVAMGMLRDVSHFDWLRVILDDVLTQTVECTSSWASKSHKRWLKYRMSSSGPAEATPETWQFLERRYGISKEEVDSFCAWFGRQSKPDLNYFIEHPLLERIHTIDVGPLSV